MKRKIIIIAVLTLTPLIAYYGFASLKKFFAIDKCLDLGGSWNYTLNKCHYEDLNNPNIITLEKNYNHIKEVIDSKDLVLRNYLEKEYGINIIGFENLEIMDERNATVYVYDDSGSIHLKIKLYNPNRLIVTLLGMITE